MNQFYVIYNVNQDKFILDIIICDSDDDSYVGDTIEVKYTEEFVLASSYSISDIKFFLGIDHYFLDNIINHLVVMPIEMKYDKIDWEECEYLLDLLE